MATNTAISYPADESDEILIVLQKYALQSQA